MGNLINNNLSTTSSSNTTSTNQSDNTQFTTDARIAKQKAKQAKTLAAASSQTNAQSATAKADDVLSSVDSLLYQATTTEVETDLLKRITRLFEYEDPNAVEILNIKEGDFEKADKAEEKIRHMSAAGKLDLASLSDAEKKELYDSYKELKEFISKYKDVKALEKTGAIPIEHDVNGAAKWIATIGFGAPPTVLEIWGGVSYHGGKNIDENKNFFTELVKEMEGTDEEKVELPKLDPTKFSVANDNTHENWGGLGEKWIKNEAGDWHYMILNDETGETDVYKWDSGTKAGMTNGEDTKVGSFDAKYFNDPSELGPEKPEDLFVANNKTYDNWGGLGEKWVKNDQGQWHYLIQNEETGETDVYRWDSGTKEGMKNGEDTKVASLSANYYNEPNTLGSTSLSEKRTTFKRSEQGTFDNYLGKGEKWIQNEVGEWHYIVLENELDETTNTYSQVAKLFQWTSGSKEAAMNGEDTLLSNIDLKYFVDPSLLETDPIQLLETASKEARDGGELLADS